MRQHRATFVGQQLVKWESQGGFSMTLNHPQMHCGLVALVFMATSDPMYGRVRIASIGTLNYGRVCKEQFSAKN